MKVYDLDVDIQFGGDDVLPDWRRVGDDDNDEENEDEELVETPAGVMALLGFDPRG